MKTPFFKSIVRNSTFSLKKLFIWVLIVCFTNTGLSPVSASAQELTLPKPGVMVHLSPPMELPVLKAIKVHTDNPFRFDFVLDKGDSTISSDELKSESNKLIKYFLASLTIPEKDLWVNLSPYEKDRIVPESFGVTEMGRDLLAEDYMLKQITASLIYPEGETGKKFWKRIYEEAQKKYGNINVPVNTFNKVWIVPEKAVVYENAKAGAAYVVESKLKVLLEADYLSMQKHASKSIPRSSTQDILSEAGLPQNRVLANARDDAQQIGTDIVRQIVIPELTKEVNEGKNFAQLRQVYNSLILATWYKKKIKDSILSKVYADKSKTKGVNIDDPKQKEEIYQQYLKAFKKGVYNYIKEESDPITNEKIPRKYFSGGLMMALTIDEKTNLNTAAAMKVIGTEPPEGISNIRGAQEVTVDIANSINLIPTQNKDIDPSHAMKSVDQLKADLSKDNEPYMVDRLAGFLNQERKGKNVVFIATGKGVIEADIADLNKDLNVVATDSYNDPMYWFNNDDFKNGKLPGQILAKKQGSKDGNIVVLKADGEAFIRDLPEGSVDEIVLIHPEDKITKAALDLIKDGVMSKVLKKGGRFVIKPFAKKDDLKNRYLSIILEHPVFVQMHHEDLEELYGVNINERSNYKGEVGAYVWVNAAMSGTQDKGEKKLAAKPRLLVVDDRETHLEDTKNALQDRYDVTTVLIKNLDLEEAARVIDQNDRFDLVISDLDYSRKLLQKLSNRNFQGKKVPVRMAGMFFLQWLQQHHKAPANMILHSTIFEPKGSDRYLALFTGSSPTRVRKEMEDQGVFVQPKTVTYQGKLPQKVLDYEADFNASHAMAPLPNEEKNPQGKPTAPKLESADVPFKTVELPMNEKEVMDSLKLPQLTEIVGSLNDFIQQHQLNLGVQINDSDYLRRVLAFVFENLVQHEYFKGLGSSQDIYYRIYQSGQNVRLEFWGPGKHDLPNEFLDDASHGVQYKFFDWQERPWDSIEAPAKAVQGGKNHEGITHMINMLGHLKGGLVKYGWRIDHQMGGHLIAFEFPLNNSFAIAPAETGQASAAMLVDQFKAMLRTRGALIADLEKTNPVPIVSSQIQDLEWNLFDMDSQKGRYLELFVRNGEIAAYGIVTLQKGIAMLRFQSFQKNVGEGDYWVSVYRQRVAKLNESLFKKNNIEFVAVPPDQIVSEDQLAKRGRALLTDWQSATLRLIDSVRHGKPLDDIGRRIVLKDSFPEYYSFGPAANLYVKKLGFGFFISAAAPHKAQFSPTEASILGRLQKGERLSDLEVVQLFSGRGVIGKVGDLISQAMKSAVGDRLQLSEGTLKPDEGYVRTFLLNVAPTIKDGDHVLEIGTGSGVLTKGLAESIPRRFRNVNFVATDIEENAFRDAQENLKGHDNVEVRKGDLFEPVQGEKFNVIFWNPPWYKEEFGRKRGRALIDEGYESLNKFFSQVAGYLNPGGRIYLVFERESSGDLYEMAEKNGLLINEMPVIDKNSNSTAVVFELSPNSAMKSRSSQSVNMPKEADQLIKAGVVTVMASDGQRFVFTLNRRAPASSNNFTITVQRPGSKTIEGFIDVANGNEIGSSFESHKGNWYAIQVKQNQGYKGVGRALMSLAMWMSKSLGKQRFFVRKSTDNDFYGGLGFTSINTNDMAFDLDKKPIAELGIVPDKKSAAMNVEVRQSFRVETQDHFSDWLKSVLREPLAPKESAFLKLLNDQFGAKKFPDLESYYFHGLQELAQSGIVFRLNDRQSVALMQRIQAQLNVHPAGSMPFTYQGLALVKQMPFYKRDIRPAVFVKETPIQDANGKQYNLFHVIALNKLSEDDRRKSLGGSYLTDFYFVNGVFAGYGVMILPGPGSEQVVKMQYHIFEYTGNPAYGRGKVPGLSRAIFNKRLELLQALLPSNVKAQARVLNDQYPNPEHLRFYTGIKFNGMEFSSSPKHLDDGTPVFLSLDLPGTKAVESAAMNVDDLVDKNGKVNLGLFEELVNDVVKEANKQTRGQIGKTVRVYILGGVRYLLSSERPDVDLVFIADNGQELTKPEQETYFIAFRRALDLLLGIPQDPTYAEFSKRFYLRAGDAVVHMDPYFAPFVDDHSKIFLTEQSFLLARIKDKLEEYLGLNLQVQSFTRYHVQAIKDYLAAEYYMGDLGIWRQARNEFLNLPERDRDQEGLALLKQFRQRVEELFKASSDPDVENKIKERFGMSLNDLIKAESPAMGADQNGGIDLSSNKFLQTQNAGEGIKFHMDPAMLQQLQNAPGFYPVIISIQPMTDLRKFLGLSQTPSSQLLQHA